MQRQSIYKHYEPGLQPKTGNGSRAYWFVYSTTKLLVYNSEAKAGIPYLTSLAEYNLSPLRTQYLGLWQGSPCFAAEVAPDTIPPEGHSFTDLRSIYSSVEEDIFLLAGKALQISSWDQTHQFCGRCGQKTETMPGERAKKCPACGLINYPRLSPAAITAVLKNDKILLAHSVAFRGNMYSLIAGFVEPGETLEECVRREVKEEVSLLVKNIKYFASQPWPFPNSLMIGFTAEYESGEIAVDKTEISDAGWYDVNNLPDLPGKMSIARELIDWYAGKHKG